MLIFLNMRSNFRVEKFQLLLLLISAERFWNARYLYDKYAAELWLLQFR